MVRSHIGNVVCRKALCVRVASSPPKTASAFAGAVSLRENRRECQRIPPENKIILNKYLSDKVIENLCDQFILYHFISVCA